MALASAAARRQPSTPWSTTSPHLSVVITGTCAIASSCVRANPSEIVGSTKTSTWLAPAARAYRQGHGTECCRAALQDWRRDRRWSHHVMTIAVLLSKRVLDQVGNPLRRFTCPRNNTRSQTPRPTEAWLAENLWLERRGTVNSFSGTTPCSTKAAFDHSELTKTASAQDHSLQPIPVVCGTAPGRVSHPSHFSAS